MSAREGEVWLIEAGCWANRKVALRLAEGWSHVNGVNMDGDGIVTPVRPLVVIDPDDRRAVENLRDLMDRFYAEHSEGERDFPAIHTGARGNAMQAALREFANPTPPKPDEPTGLGAVFFADCGCARGRKRFVRDDTGSEFPTAPWKSDCGHHIWADLDIRDEDDILAEGLPS